MPAWNPGRICATASAPRIRSRIGLPDRPLVTLATVLNECHLGSCPAFTVSDLDDHLAAIPRLLRFFAGMGLALGGPRRHRNEAACSNVGARRFGACRCGLFGRDGGSPAVQEGPGSVREWHAAEPCCR